MTSFFEREHQFINFDKALCLAQRKDVIKAENITGIDWIFRNFFLQFFIIVVGELFVRKKYFSLLLCLQ